MSRRDKSISLRQMLDHAKEAVAFASGKARDDLDRDRLLNLALVRLVEIIGEAAGRVSEGDQAAHSEIPWASIVGMRNRLIHGYDQIDLSILWQVVTKDLPPLIEQLETILQKLLPTTPQG